MSVRVLWPETRILTLGQGVQVRGALATGGFPKTGLVAYWKLDEAAGNRLDSSGNGHTMVPVLAPGVRAGKIGNAVDIPNDANILRCADDALALAVGASRAWCCWVYVDAYVDVDAFPMGRWVDGGASDWALDVKNTGICAVYVGHSGGGSSSAGTLAGAVVPGAWFFFAGWFDRTVGTNGTIYVQINNGITYSAALAAAHTRAGAGTNTSIGKLGDNAFGDFNGAVDEAGIWDRVLTDPERTTLYNGGAGLTYS